MLHLFSSAIARYLCAIHNINIDTNLSEMLNSNSLSEKKKSRPESVDCTPSDPIIPGSSERPLLPLQPQSKEQKGPNCIKVLTTSGWNPPPGKIWSTKVKES